MLTALETEHLTPVENYTGSEQPEQTATTRSGVGLEKGGVYQVQDWAGWARLPRDDMRASGVEPLITGSPGYFPDLFRPLVRSRGIRAAFWTEWIAVPTDRGLPGTCSLVSATWHVLRR